MCTRKKDVEKLSCGFEVNVFFVLGVSATIFPLPMGNITNFDIAVLIGASLLFWLVGWFFKKRTITRLEGAFLVACYVAYTAWLIGA